MGFGHYAAPAANNAFSQCACPLAVGTRFSEIPTGSYSMPVPATPIHLDINPPLFNASYPATLSIEGDAASCCDYRQLTQRHLPQYRQSR